MATRRRVSLTQSFKIAGKGALSANDPTGGEGSLLLTIIFGFWWWIVGVPAGKSEHQPGP